MIDWEKGTCDFSGELFAKILEIAKRYADPERKALDAEEKWLVSSYRPMWNPQKQLESKGYVIINYLFDDGNYPAYTRFGNTLLINANTKYQEGIWEFIEYFLVEEGQCYATEGNDVLPSREMTRNAFAHDLKLLEEGRMQTTSEFTPEAIEELYAFTEQGRSIPLRPKEVLDIIYEEAQSFCNGDKPLEDVCNVIQKRVQIYISESM